jgi:hypothetical protein
MSDGLVSKVCCNNSRISITQSSTSCGHVFVTLNVQLHGSLQSWKQIAYDSLSISDNLIYIPQDGVLMGTYVMGRHLPEHE